MVTLFVLLVSPDTLDKQIVELEYSISLHSTGGFGY